MISDSKQKYEIRLHFIINHVKDDHIIVISDNNLHFLPIFIKNIHTQQTMRRLTREDIIKKIEMVIWLQFVAIDILILSILVREESSITRASASSKFF